MNFSLDAQSSRSFRNVKSLLIIAIAGLFFFTLTSCDDDNITDADNNDEPGINEVWMEGHSFTPSTLTIESGTTVTWTNQSDEVHTVTSGVDGDHDGEFDSGNLSPGEEYSYTFDETGEYDYYCIPHHEVGMTGRIVVTEDGTNGSNGNNGNGDDGDDGNGY